MKAIRRRSIRRDSSGLSVRLCIVEMSFGLRDSLARSSIVQRSLPCQC